MNFDPAPVLLTVKLAILTTGILAITGIPIAYFLSFSKSRFVPALDAIVTLPLVLPPTVLGFYMLLAFAPTHFPGSYFYKSFNMRLVFTFWGILIGSVLFSLPFMVKSLQSGFSSVPIVYVEAAYTLGKTKWETLWFVILPNASQFLFTGCILSFLHTIGEFGVVLMLGGSIPGETKVLSISIFEAVEAMDYSLAHIYSGLIISVTLVLLLFIRKYKSGRIDI